jgi:hypothetical protein
MKTKGQERARECRKFREALMQRVGRCDICLHDPKRVRPSDIAWEMCVHEIARGTHRQKALDKPFATLVLCYLCHYELHNGKTYWTEAMQLAVLKKRRPADYDLAAYNRLIGLGPNRITEEDVSRA